MDKVKNFWRNGRNFLSQPQSNILSAAFVIAFTYGISMVLGILRDRILVAKFYSCCSEQLDAYIASFRIPDMIFQLIVIGALSSAFIPIFSEKLTKNKDEANNLASSLINLLFLAFFILCLLVYFLAGSFSKLIAAGFSPFQLELMAGITRVMLLAQIFFLISNFFSAMIQSQQRFLIPSLSPIVYNLGIILSILALSSSWGIWSAPAGVVLGSFLHLLIQLPLVLKLGFKYRLIFNWKDSSVKRVFKMMVPRTLALAASQVEMSYAVFLMSSFPAGSVTIYNLAQKLADLPVRLLGTSVGQAALPVLSLQRAEDKKEEFKLTLSRSLNQIFYLAFPATALFVIMRLQIVRFAYGAKTFPWQATLVTGKTLAVITLSIFSQSAIQLLVRGYYALCDTMTPFLSSIVSVALNIIFSLFYVRVLNWGIFGLALAFSISNLVHFLLLFLFFITKKENFIGRADIVKWLKMLVSSLVSAFLTWGTLRILDEYVFETTRSLPLLGLTVICGIVGVVSYLGLSYLLKIDELKSFFGFFRRIRKWRSNLSNVEEVIQPSSGSAGSS